MSRPVRTVYVVTTLGMAVGQPDRPVAARRWVRRAIVAAIVLAAILAALYVIGAHAQTEALSHCLQSGVTPSTGHMSFNACAHLDASQVIDRR